MIKKLKQIIWKVDGMDFTDTPSGISGQFYLKYGSITIGILVYTNGNWTFKYSDEFKGQTSLNPIIDFPDINKEYVSKDLWPFFAARIPALNQPYQFHKIEKAKADRKDPVALLKLFGNETITNPFRLYAF